MERGRQSKVIFQSVVVHKLPTKLPQKSWMKSGLPLLSRPIHCHSEATKWPGWHLGVNLFCVLCDVEVASPLPNAV
jgi:hypothetical protein